MPFSPGNDLDLGHIVGRNATLKFPRTERDKHLYVCGGTGTGKSKFLEHLIRQDIKNWHKSKCGLIVLDPHGNLYDNLMQWLAWNNKILNVPVVPIDLRQDEWVVSYNLLRQKVTADPAVLVDNLTDAMAYVWGQAGTDATPLFARWAGNILSTLYENNLTLVDAEHLMDHYAKQIRFALTSKLENKALQQDWRLADSLTAREFEAQVGSTANRLRRFIRNRTMRSVFGQPKISMDLGKALEDGSIILVSLATEGAKISKENAELFGTLLLSDLWTAASERGKADSGEIKPFYCYIDEFQRFITPTIADSLNESRGFGLHLTLANQFPNQFLGRGDAGRQVYEAVMENASSKVVFRLSHEDNLRAMAQWLFRGVMDPDEVKHKLYSTRVLDYREEWKEVGSEGRSSSRGGGKQRGKASGGGSGGTENFEGEETYLDPLTTSLSTSKFASDSESDSDFWSDTTSESKSLVPTLVPILGKELSHVQYRSLDEQLFRAMAVLFDQKEQQGVVRLVSMNAPVSLFTPTIEKMPGSSESMKRFLDDCYAKLPFAIPGAQAQRQVADRSANFAAQLLKEVNDEVGSNRRKAG